MASPARGHMRRSWSRIARSSSSMRARFQQLRATYILRLYSASLWAQCSCGSVATNIVASCSSWAACSSLTVFLCSPACVQLMHESAPNKSFKADGTVGPPLNSSVRRQMKLHQYNYIAKPSDPSEVLAWFRSLDHKVVEVQSSQGLLLHFSELGDL